MSNETICRLATPEEFHPAMALAMGSPTRPAGEQQINDFLRFAVGRGLDLSRIYLAQSGDRLVWSILPIVSPGRTMLLLAPPRFAESGDAACVIELTDQVCRDYGARDVHLGQVLLDPSEQATRQMYGKAGFAELAELIYLLGTAPRSAARPLLDKSLRFETYSPQTHAFFAAAILQSYIGSLDCPALSGMREIEDIILGHRATGDFDPSLWYVLLGPGDKPLGVLLLARTVAADLLELVYIGLVPEARRRGIGEILMRQAMGSVIINNRRRLQLAVDSRNAPALKLYFRHGMQRITSKVALLRDLRPAEAGRRPLSTFRPQVR